MVDGRWVKYAETDKQKEVVELVIKSDSQAKAAEKLGLNKRTLERHLAKVKANASYHGDALLPLGGQSMRMFDEDGVFTHWDKTHKTKVSTAEMLEEMRAGIDCKIAKPKKAPKGVGQNICSVLPIADSHLGMLAYGLETGSEDYDTAIARDRLVHAVDYLLPKGFKAKHGVMMNLGDLIHFDGMRAVTPQSGNILDVDSRYGFVVRNAVAVIRYAIDKMLEHCETVHVMNVRGNHDESSALFLNILCQHVYANEPRVLTIPDNDCKVMTHQWERNFIYAYHGDGLKPQVAYNNATRDYAREFADCNYVWMPSGHLHNERVQWIGKAKLEIITTLAPADAWHASHGYGSHREMNRIDLHPLGGRIGGATFNPAIQLEAA